VDIKLGGNPTTPEAQAEVLSLGGLFVLGTERHEARRIDNQLRGRSGRQGDAGATQFFVSLEDSLMRIFASDTIKTVMGKLGVAEDEAVENRLITRSLETAQTKIEGFNFDSRKHVLEYDDVLNLQRKTVYERRRKILVGTISEVKEKLAEVVGDDADLLKVIAEKVSAVGEEVYYRTIRQLLLQTIDMFWVEHLELMDYVRSSVNLRAYGQRDPLVEYKKEGLRLFKEMQEAINDQIWKLFPNVGGVALSQEQVKLQEVPEQAQVIGSGDGDSNKVHSGTSQASVVPKNADGEKIGRNDLCHCGSGKKFKKCHGS